MEFLLNLDVPIALSEALGVTFVVAIAIAVSGLARVVMRQAVRRAVRRAINGRGRWRVRLPRSYDNGSAEQRRLQRADAAANMLSRITTVVVALFAAIVVTRILGFDPVVLLSSAGFLGAGLAFGGQHVIKDWIAGLVVLVGDEITLTVGPNDITGTVETLGSTGVRLRLRDGGTWHGGHGYVEGVVNHSQKLVHSTIEDHSSVA